MNKAVFLDRDGVINRKAREGAYVTRWEEIEILPGVAAAIARLNEAGLRVIVVTNQRCIAKGLVTAPEVEGIHQKMCRELSAEDAMIDAVYYCPHEIQPLCSCRKPAPGMLFTAAREHEIDLAKSWMIGDSDIDITAGKNAGCKTARLISGSEFPSVTADIVTNSLLDAVHKILQAEDLPQYTATRTSALI